MGGVFKIDKGVRGVKSETIPLSSLVGLVVGLVVSVLGLVGSAGVLRLLGVTGVCVWCF